MGRASATAWKPTASPAAGSTAPMENSPPGIHTIPPGVSEGATLVARMVGPKTVASAVSAVGWPASTLLAGERGHGRDTAIATAAETIVRAAKIHTERLSAGSVDAECAPVRFSRFM